MAKEWTISSAYLVNRHQAKTLRRRYRAEVASCFDNLRLVLKLLEAGTPVNDIPYPFFRTEGNGVFRIGQTGVPAAQEMRLYVTFIFVAGVAYILSIGTKNTQQRDIADAQRAARQIRRDTP